MIVLGFIVPVNVPTCSNSRQFCLQISHITDEFVVVFAQDSHVTRQLSNLFLERDHGALPYLVVDAGAWYLGAVACRNLERVHAAGVVSRCTLAVYYTHDGKKQTHR